MRREFSEEGDTVRAIDGDRRSPLKLLEVRRDAAEPPERLRSAAVVSVRGERGHGKAACRLKRGTQSNGANDQERPAQLTPACSLLDRRR
jgi:hypothetical protein